jgi:hypothetical protein
MRQLTYRFYPIHVARGRYPEEWEVIYAKEAETHDKGLPTYNAARTPFQEALGPEKWQQCVDLAHRYNEREVEVSPDMKLQYVLLNFIGMFLIKYIS